MIFIYKVFPKFEKNYREFRKITSNHSGFKKLLGETYGRVFLVEKALTKKKY